MLEAKLACDSGCTWVCPPSACLSKTELGWATLATFWWQVAQWALEIPVWYPAIAPGRQWEATGRPEITDLSANQGIIHGIRGQWWFMSALTTVYLLRGWTRKKLCSVYKIKTYILFFPSSGSTAWLVTVMLVKYVGIASRKPEVLRRRPHCAS